MDRARRPRAACVERGVSLARAAVVILGIGPLAVLATSCTSSPGEPACVPDPTPTCKPTYDPATYDTLYTKLFHPTCASGSGTCHTSDAAKAGLVFESEDASYDLLLGRQGGRVRVNPGDVGCSLLMKRVASTDPSFHMPPGDGTLTDGEVCSIARWIAAGAPR